MPHLRAWLSACLVITGAPPALAAFTVNPGGTVTDSTTGLIWDQCTYGTSGATCQSGTVESAMGDKWPLAFMVVSTANAANYKGHNDWRLPSKNELESLVDRSIGGLGAKIDLTAFPNTLGSVPSPARYWTSTTIHSNPAFFWFVDFGSGSVNAGEKSAASDSSLYFTRLVRGGTGTTGYKGTLPGHTVSVASVTGLASAAPSGTHTINNGQTIAFTLTAQPGYVLQSASGCAGTLVGNVYTTGASVTSDCVVTPVMGPIPTAGSTQPVPTLGSVGLLALAGLLPWLARRRRLFTPRG